MALAGWYEDPGTPGRLRYFDGNAWTSHTSASAKAPTVAKRWRGMGRGLPEAGVGSLATPWRRLGGYALDTLYFLPVSIVFYLLFRPTLKNRLQSLTSLPKLPQNATNEQVNEWFRVWWPHFWRDYLGILATTIAIAVVINLLFALYMAITTGIWGASPGKLTVGTRPITLEQQRLGWGRSFGRAFSNLFLGYVPVVSLLNPLWCTWDENTQCLTDKMAKTLVVMTRDTPSRRGASALASPSARSSQGANRP